MEWNFKYKDSLYKKIHASFKEKKQEFAELITTEMGMPILELLLDIDSGLEYIEKKGYGEKNEISI